ncbi:hypothetical protein IKG16_01380 [Candidatus Saccharibacteria bacterium]|nr:hypothetical protein [Candidatus Saccharibacteria bacterium]
MKRLIKIKSVVGIVAMLALGLSSIFGLRAYADDLPPRYIQISPTQQHLNLQPGQSFDGSYTVSNIGTDAFTFEVGVVPYSTQSDKYEPDFTTTTNYTQLAKWVTFPKTSFHIEPNSSVEVNYTINVPTDVPNGGQYAALTASVENGEKGGMKTTSRAAMLLIAKIPGETRETGSILENNIPGIVFGGNKIEATSLLENTGNIHADAKYTMKVYPFGSNEEVFTNEEEPDGVTLLPETKRYHSITWEETPQLGLFTVEQTIEYMGQTSTTSKLVLVCPVWLIVIFIALILAIIFTIVTRARSRKQSRRESSASRSHSDKPEKKSEDD